LSATPLPKPSSEHAIASTIAAVVKEVAGQLRNTPAVCRNSYINPAVFDAWRTGRLHRIVPAEAARSAPRKFEAIALKLLRTKAGGKGEARR
jgi:DNA topoisomerase IB